MSEMSSIVLVASVFSYSQKKIAVVSRGDVTVRHCLRRYNIVYRGEGKKIKHLRRRHKGVHRYTLTDDLALVVRVFCVLYLFCNLSVCI